MTRLALGFVTALLLATGIGFASWGLFQALAPVLEPPLAALAVGGAAFGLAGLLLVPWPRCETQSGLNIQGTRDLPGFAGTTRDQLPRKIRISTKIRPPPEAAD